MVSTFLSSVLFGGFARMMMRHIPAIVETASEFILNRQKIKLAQAQSQNPQSQTCQTVCNYNPDEVVAQEKKTPDPFKIKVWKGFLKVGIIGILFLSIVLYLAYDFALMRDLVKTYYRDESQILQILEGYRQIAIQMLGFITSWAIADKADEKIYNAFKK